MRTEKQWLGQLEPKIFKQFPPRLQRDLTDFPYKLSDIPKFGSHYIYGDTSTGKTLMAAHMYLQARKKQYFERLPGKFFFISAHDFFEELKESFDSPDKDEHAIMAKYRIAEFLVLDDLGDTRFTDWSISQLQVLINYRYEYLLPTVITSNLDLNQLAEASGDDRISSRITRMGKLLKLQKNWWK